MNKDVVLTPSEAEIAELYAWGASQKEIAEMKFKSFKTINKHLENIYRKTGCTKANELAAWWFCKSFNISFDLSPLKRTLITASLLLLVIISEFIPKREMIRTKRTEKIELTSKYREDYD